MPELPDVELYRRALEERMVGRRLAALRLGSPFVLRTVQPAQNELEGRGIVEVRRIGKRLAFDLEPEGSVVVHLMVAGRFQWFEAGGAAQVALRAKNRLLAIDVTDEEGDVQTLLLTEAGKKRRASLHLFSTRAESEVLDRGGLEVLEASFPEFCEVLDRENHTVKRTLTDPRLMSGIGNAYSDEILHRAGLSPLRWTSRLDEEMRQRLYESCREVLTEWTERLVAEAAGRFPKKVTAFRPEMAVHGKFDRPCPVCSAPVQRIVYAENECNYCAACQTGGRLLADRALSKLLRGDWPRTLQELEERSDRRSG